MSRAMQVIALLMTSSLSSIAIVNPECEGMRAAWKLGSLEKLYSGWQRYIYSYSDRIGAKLNYALNSIVG